MLRTLYSPEPRPSPGPFSVPFDGHGFAEFGAQFGELGFSVPSTAVPSSTAFTFDTSSATLNSLITINIVVNTTP